MTRLLPLLLLIPLQGCAMMNALEGMPVQLESTNAMLVTAGEQVVRSSALLETSNAHMAEVPTMMAKTHEGMDRTNALMIQTHAKMDETQVLMQGSIDGVAETNGLMGETHALMAQTNQLMQASNAQLSATYVLIASTCVLSFLGGLFLYVQFRRIPRQLDAWLELAREQRVEAHHPRFRQSRRLQHASGVGAVDLS